MQALEFLFSFILHIDEHLVEIVNNFGIWTYVIVFLIIFIETGLVIFPFLPGDSLLFAASALAAISKYNLNIFVFFVVFLVAAVIGDTVNYEIGRKLGMNAPDHPFFGKFIKREKLDKAETFFAKHGGKTIVIARFMPFIRTFAPFVSGASNMHYGNFIRYNFLGGFLWVTLCCSAGFFFGNIPFVSEHFSMVVLGIVAISLIPIVITYIRSKLIKTTPTEE